MSRVLEDKNTSVIFLCANNKDSGGIKDAYYGYYKFLTEGSIPESNLHVFVNKEHKETEAIFQVLLERNPGNLKNPDEVLNFIAHCKTKNILIIVSGHGWHKGLEEFKGTKFNPQTFKNAIARNGIAKNIVFIWGPCYTGIFKKLSKDQRIIQLAAADLVSSLNWEPPKKLGIKTDWLVNIFLFYLYEWIFDAKTLVSKDHDGDGEATLYDLYNQITHDSHSYLLKSREGMLNTIGYFQNEKSTINKKIEDKKAEWTGCVDPVQKASLATEYSQLVAHRAALPIKINNFYQALFNEQIPWSCNIDKLLSVRWEITSNPPDYSKVPDHLRDKPEKDPADST